ncbi:hypothetical protein JOD54_001424 [Actinokineospora baliensis]|uniref:hypothetical protein n=1 Tax=Actinokineospora baliensis TaxID=547056 RepID=UPI00195D1846|nr:hypothetical protein [Actinokineospora baliensis]MBM7771220.1 hypothetical protein [Actinokineospora baliensis]
MSTALPPARAPHRRKGVVGDIDFTPQPAATLPRLDQLSPITQRRHARAAAR